MVTVVLAAHHAHLAGVDELYAPPAESLGQYRKEEVLGPMDVQDVRLPGFENGGEFSSGDER